jgi:hypothetical protein
MKSCLARRAVEVLAAFLLFEGSHILSAQASLTARTARLRGSGWVDSPHASIFVTERHAAILDSLDYLPTSLSVLSDEYIRDKTRLTASVYFWKQ